MSSANKILAARAGSMPGPKRGSALFEGNSYPRKWSEYIGQDDAVRYLRASCASAKARTARLDHVMIATGAHGIGKSALARLVANEMDAGLVEVQGVVELKDAIRIFTAMSDGDILFWDEIHMAVSKGKAKIEWLLSLLQDGVIIDAGGIYPVPDVTIIAATTDVQKLPETIISRFTVKPVLESYTDEQALVITKSTAARIWEGLSIDVPNEQVCRTVAEAASNNPRAISQLLRTLRDSILSGDALNCGGGLYATDMMFKWSGVTPDGLDKLGQNYLLTMLLIFRGKPAGEKSIAQALGEPTPPKYTEKLLIQKGFLQTTSLGRELTPEGVARATELAQDIQA